MNKSQFDNYNNIPAEKFAFAKGGDTRHDQKFDTKPIGYFRDAFNRFKKNKASLVAAIIILFLVLYAIVGPFMINQNYEDAYQTDKELIQYKQLLPRLKIFDGTGFWDGTERESATTHRLNILKGIAIETGRNPIVKEFGTTTTTDAEGSVNTKYKILVNQYYAMGTFNVTLTTDDYLALQKWQDENNLQVILPRVSNQVNDPQKGKALFTDIWYQVKDKRGNAELDKDGNFQHAYVKSDGTDMYSSKMRLDSDPYVNGDTENGWSYAYRSGSGEGGRFSYVVRVSAYNYFIYAYGFEPSFAFGTDANGYDIFSRLAAGARFSFILAIVVSAINLTIGAIYGAIEGYYGGIVDIAMERVSDLLSGIPFMVVTILFQLHLAAKVGVIGALIYSFVLTGWIGMASRVRMQFYRFKNQEYVLAARTLGASDWRIIWKHIFPNTLGTLITSCVLVIPGVIFSETSLSYLGIISLDSPTLSSAGTMLSRGQEVMNDSPHVVFFPALLIALLEICFNLFGNGLRDAFNPSLRGTEE